jgi:two-component system response regulator AlgR
MAKLQVVIADDEPLARARLQRLLAKNPDIDVVAIAEDGSQASQLIEQYQPELVVLDINMPIKTGLEVASDIQQSMLRPPAIIFTTAYDEFAIDAFKVDASSYLLKPIYEKDLMDAIEKAGRLNKVQVQDAAELSNNPSNLLLKRSATIELVPVAEIIFFQAREKFVIAGLKDGEEIIVDYALKELEQKMQLAFCRIHRHTLVNTSHLKKMERDEAGHYFLELKGVNGSFDVSRRQVSILKKHFQIIV